MEDSQQYPDMVTRLLAATKDALGGDFHAYYEGDPQLIPKANLPAVIVEVMSSNIGIDGAPTSMDHFVDQISIRLVMDKADDLNADDTVDLTERKLRKYVEGRDPTTGAYQKGTMMYALRNDMTFQYYATNTDVSINYDLQPRSVDLITSEAQIILTARGNILRG